jgi:hypothetical protein
MDILQWLKLDHEEMLRSVENLGAEVQSAPLGAAKVKTHTEQLLGELAAELLRHIKAEEEYLLPEIAGRFPGSDLLADLCAANHKVLKKHLKSLLKSAAEGSFEETLESVSALKKAVELHLEVQESQLMPKLRQHVPTGEREDLGQLVGDLISEIRREGIDIAGELKSSRESGKGSAKARARA